MNVEIYNFEDPKQASKQMRENHQNPNIIKYPIGINAEIYMFEGAQQASKSSIQHEKERDGSGQLERAKR